MSFYLDRPTAVLFPATPQPRNRPKTYGMASWLRPERKSITVPTRPPFETRNGNLHTDDNQDIKRHMRMALVGSLGLLLEA